MRRCQRRRRGCKTRFFFENNPSVATTTARTLPQANSSAACRRPFCIRKPFLLSVYVHIVLNETASLGYELALQALRCACGANVNGAYASAVHLGASLLLRLPDDEGDEDPRIGWGVRGLGGLRCRCVGIALRRLGRASLRGFLRRLGCFLTCALASARARAYVAVSIGGRRCGCGGAAVGADTVLIGVGGADFPRREARR